MAQRKFKDLTGQTFDLLTASTRVAVGTKHKWLCFCKCGMQVKVTTEALVSGQRKSCGCLRSTGYLIGNRYGKLTVVGYESRDTSGRIMVRCVCDCGGVKVTAARNLTRKQSALHCGCSPPTTLPALQKPEIPGMIRKIMATYKYNAKRKGNTFTLTEAEFSSLVTRHCYYCGDAPKNVKELRGHILLWNGVDRKENARGYDPENVVPCCTECNYMKCERDHDEFVERVLAISRKLNKELDAA